MIRECLDLTYAQLISKLRMEQAAVLLDLGDISIPEISALVGYTDTSSFYRAFTGYYGVTPRAYRQSGNQGTAIRGRFCD